MERLREYYRNRLRWAVTLIVAFALAYERFIPQFIPSPQQEFAGSLGAPLVGVLFLTAEWLIRTKLWRIERRELNFNGWWEGETRYTHIEKDVPGGGTALPAPARHWAKIDQDCLSIQITTTEDPFVWKSLAMDIQKPGGSYQLVYAYDVKYVNRGPAFPSKAIGFEEMDVVGAGESLFGRERPVRLSGTFAHCAQGPAPVYQGTVVFEYRRDGKAVDSDGSARDARQLAEVSTLPAASGVEAEPVGTGR